jgi:hypothetical protein
MKHITTSLATFTFVLSASTLVAQAEDGRTAVDWQGHLEALVGEWDVSGKADGEDVEGIFIFKWAPSQKYLIVCGKTWPKGAPDKADSFDGLIGWDAAKRRLREFLFTSDGASSVTHFAVKGPRGEGKRSGVNPDGTTWQQKLKYRIAEDSIVWGPEASQHIDKEGQVIGEFSDWVARRKQ